MSLGLEEAGFFPVYVNELNSDALETYFKNRQQYPHLRDKKFHSFDIKDCTKNKKFFFNLKKNLKNKLNVNQVDLICGGPPCQGYSGIGVRRSYAVEKESIPANSLFLEMVTFIRNLKPNIFLFENVEGLLTSRWKKSGKKGEVFQDVFGEFESIDDYEVKYSLIKSKDYGVPQNRPRVLVVGIKKNLLSSSKLSLDIDAVSTGFLPKGESDFPSIPEILGDLVDENFEFGKETLKYPKSAKTKWQKMARTHQQKISRKGSFLSEHQYSKHSLKVQKKFQSLIDKDKKNIEKFRTKKFAQRVLPMKWGKEGPTITITSLPDDFIHFKQNRSLTVRECARLQTFPDWYQFHGKRTTGGIRRAGNPLKDNHFRELPKYTQIGNAVPVKLAYELGKHFIKNFLT